MYQLNPLLEGYARAELSDVESPDNDPYNGSNGTYNKNHKYYGTFKGTHSIYAIRKDPLGRKIIIRWYKTPSNPSKENMFLVHYLGKKKILTASQLNVFMNKVKAVSWNDGMIDPDSDIEKQNMRDYLHLYQKYGGGRFSY